MGKKTNGNKKIKNRLVTDKELPDLEIKFRRYLKEYHPSKYQQLLNLEKEEKKVHVVVSLFSGCLNEVKAFTDVEEAKKEYERQILKAGFCNVEEYEELLRSAIIEKEEPRLLENVEVHQSGCLEASGLASDGVE